MKRRLSFLCLAILCCCRTAAAAAVNDSIDFSALLGEPIPELSEQAVPFRPEWKVQIVDRWEGGSIREVLMCAPDRDWPMKRLCYYPSGAIAEESDLEPYSGLDEAYGRANGASVEYYETGDMKRVCRYERGVQEGTERFFDESGKTLYEAEYQHGKLHGRTILYWLSGAPRSEDRYVDGLLHGLCRTLYESGEKESEATYSHGLLEGRKFAWWQQGTVKEMTHWTSGFLHDESASLPAVVTYSEDGHLYERQSYIGGQPHGWYV